MSKPVHHDGGRRLKIATDDQTNHSKRRLSMAKKRERFVRVWRSGTRRPAQAWAGARNVIKNMQNSSTERGDVTEHRELPAGGLSDESARPTVPAKVATGTPAAGPSSPSFHPHLRAQWRRRHRQSRRGGGRPRELRPPCRSPASSDPSWYRSAPPHKGRVRTSG